MARSAIPDFGIEYPEYEYRPFPKHVGFDEAGEPLTAKDQAEFDELKELAVFPKLLGKDKAGKEVIANTPRDEEFLKGKVVKASVSVENVENALTDAPVKRGPGRPKAEAA